jgi:hypothetical protein
MNPKSAGFMPHSLLRALTERKIGKIRGFLWTDIGEICP